MAKEREKKNHSSRPSPDKEERNTYARISGITFELLALNLAIIWGGYYLNDFLNTRFPWVLMAAVFLSVIATIYYLLKKFGS